jgi:hypothetical protein
MQFKEWLLDYELLHFLTEKVEFKKVGKQIPGRDTMIARFRERVGFRTSPRDKLNWIRHTIFNYEDELKKAKGQRTSRHLDNCHRVKIWRDFVNEAYKIQIKFIVHLTGEGEPEDLQEREDLIVAAREWFHEHWDAAPEECGLPGEQEERNNIERIALQELQQEKYSRAA